MRVGREGAERPPSVNAASRTASPVTGWGSPEQGRRRDQGHVVVGPGGPDCLPPEVRERPSPGYSLVGEKAV